ncbi:carbonic anhydrase [Chloropicon roscoffensis]|uniref:Carbonic anhydrase n=2 Tax=Chloropicon roscoffensis TaxID=1461544 RepID=A0AAX4PI16_9CHLO
MMKSSIALALAAILAPVALAASGEFDYSANGLDWASVAELCGTGQAQSPIDLQSANAVPAASQAGNRGPTTFDFAPGSNVRIENTGHGLNTMFDVTDLTAVIETEDGPQSLEPLQFHWHSPSEHSIDGVIYPLEVHLVTMTNVTGDLAVIGMMYKYGEENELLNKLWPGEADDFAFRIKGEEIPEGEEYLHDKGAETSLGGESTIDVMKDLLPENKSYYAYKGSLTTPPCSEGVYWHVLKEPLEATVDQVLNFQNVLAETSEGIRTNNRSPMPLNGREVVVFEDA